MGYAPVEVMEHEIGPMPVALHVVRPSLEGIGKMGWGHYSHDAVREPHVPLVHSRKKGRVQDVDTFRKIWEEEEKKGIWICALLFPSRWNGG